MKAVDRLLNRKVPYVRRKWTKTTRIRTVIREEPVRLTQYIRGRRTSFRPTLLKSKIDRSIIDINL